ncbi:MAG: ComEA family DNA-binding protein [Chloroflexota bacterium]
MERVGEWRLIEPEETEAKPAPAAEKSGGGGGWRALAVGVAALVLGIAGVAIWLAQPTGGVALEAEGVGVVPTGRISAIADLVATAEPAIVVDVEGAVVDPGVHSLPAGSRVADAIAAAGGYSTQVDIAAAAASLNLAERVADGQKIHVPARGEGQTLSGAATPAPAGSGGLIDINHATSEELESLPGIGPVTAGKIVDAREVQPFASVDELDTRDVVGPSTLAQIRGLITVTP